jgi:pimeloyl-ACP methyl ester carboxylesterase
MKQTGFLWYDRRMRFNPLTIQRKWRFGCAGFFLAAVLLVAVPMCQGSGQAIEQRLRSAFPEAAGKAEATYGLFAYGSGKQDPVQGKIARGVVLIHGLDEPGRVWLNLAPALDRNGFRVWQFVYPNDQDIEASARFLFENLADLARNPGGTSPMALVAHSMGGLWPVRC